MKRLLAAALAWLAAAPALASPLASQDMQLAGVPARVERVDLADAATVLTVTLANQDARAPERHGGDAPFSALMREAHAAALINGTYFRTDAARSLMGTMVQAGTLVNHVSFRPKGTAFALLPGNRPRMTAAAAAPWREHWLSLVAGPRLLTDGRVMLDARGEGFSDPDVLGLARRSALGYTRDGHTLYLVSFPRAISLAQEAAGMRALGCWQAMNLDGGTSCALAEGGRLRVAPGRALTNAIAVYDAAHPAPAGLQAAFRRFVRVAATPEPLRDGDRWLDPGPFASGRCTPSRKLHARPYNFEGWDFFRASGAPVVRNHDGWLELAGGAIATRLPPGPFSCLTLPGPAPLVLEAGWRLAIAATALELRDREGHLLLSRPLASHDPRRRLELVPLPAGLRVALDHQPLLTLPHTQLPKYLRFSGTGAVKDLSPER